MRHQKEQKEKNKNYILANIDKYVIDGRGNFYWEAAKEGMEYIYWENVSTDYCFNDECWEIGRKIGERILETKEDWGLDFIEDDIHKRPVLLLRNKKSGRITNPYPWTAQDRLIGKTINDYKGVDKKILVLLRVRGIITKEQTKLLEKLEKAEWENLLGRTLTSNDNPQREEVEKQREEQNHLYGKELEKQAAVRDKQQNQEQIVNQTPRSSLPASDINSKLTNQKPTINTTIIENSNNITEALHQTEQQINQLLINKKLKTTDLPKEYQNWTEQIKNLTTNEELSDYAQKLEQTLTELVNQQHQPTTKINNLSLSVKIGIGIGLSLVMIGIFSVLMIKRSKKKI